MRKKRLGNSDLELTPIGVGAWPFRRGRGQGARGARPSSLRIHECARVWNESIFTRSAGPNPKRTGVSNFQLRHLRRAQAVAPLTSLQPPYSAISPEAEQELFPYCLENQIGVLTYSPMKSGLLAGKMTKERFANFGPEDFRRHAAAFQEPAH
jgi:aryl-alcohol dehydrogenase-like predicted oxidoreductase